MQISRQSTIYTTICIQKWVTLNLQIIYQSILNNSNKATKIQFYFTNMLLYLLTSSDKKSLKKIFINTTYSRTVNFTTNQINVDIIELLSLFYYANLTDMFTTFYYYYLNIFFIYMGCEKFSLQNLEII